jgi:hypothetical protein
VLRCCMRWLQSTALALLPWALVIVSDEASRGSTHDLVVGPPVFSLPQEPEEFDRREVEAYYDWRNNLFFRLFSMSGSENQTSFMTARRTYKVSVNRYGYEVAVTFANPLFYWLDLNENGEFETGQGEMWIDIEEDGVNGNEKPYDPIVKDDTPRGPIPSPPVPLPKQSQERL